MLDLLKGLLLPHHITGKAYIIQQNKLYNLNMTQEEMADILTAALKWRNTLYKIDKSKGKTEHFVSYIDMEITKRRYT